MVIKIGPKDNPTMVYEDDNVIFNAFTGFKANAGNNLTMPAGSNHKDRVWLKFQNNGKWYFIAAVPVSIYKPKRGGVVLPYMYFMKDNEKWTLEKLTSKKWEVSQQVNQIGQSTGNGNNYMTNNSRASRFTMMKLGVSKIQVKATTNTIIAYSYSQEDKCTSIRHELGIITLANGKTTNGGWISTNISTSFTYTNTNDVTYLKNKEAYEDVMSKAGNKFDANVSKGKYGITKIWQTATQKATSTLTNKKTKTYAKTLSTHAGKIYFLIASKTSIKANDKGPFGNAYSSNNDHRSVTLKTTRSSVWVRYTGRNSNYTHPTKYMTYQTKVFQTTRSSTAHLRTFNNVNSMKMVTLDKKTGRTEILNNPNNQFQSSYAYKYNGTHTAYYQSTMSSATSSYSGKNLLFTVNQTLASKVYNCVAIYHDYQKRMLNRQQVQVYKNGITYQTKNDDAWKRVSYYTEVGIQPRT